MKRSQMLQLMMDEIIHIEDLDDVSILLRNMEKVGMIPPNYEIKDDGDFVQSFDNIKIIMGRWEDE